MPRKYMQQPRLVSTTDRRSARWTASAAARAIVTCLVILVVESAVCGASASLPALLLYASARAIADPWLRVVAVAVGLERSAEIGATEESADRPDRAAKNLAAHR